jgi:hypothetical protein
MNRINSTMLARRPLLISAVAFCIVISVNAKEGCTVEGGNTLCCNCGSSGSCGDASCKWTGDPVNGSCGPKSGIVKLNNEVALSDQFLRQSLIVTAKAQNDVAKAQRNPLHTELATTKETLAQAQARLVVAKRASEVAQKNIERAKKAQPSGEQLSIK